MASVRLSKNFRYERPYYVTGIIQHSGSKGKPKGIWKDTFIGTGKAMDVETADCLRYGNRKYRNRKYRNWKYKNQKYWIICFYHCESSGTTVETAVMAAEEQPQVVSF